MADVYICVHIYICIYIYIYMYILIYHAVWRIKTNIFSIHHSLWILLLTMNITTHYAYYYTLCILLLIFHSWKRSLTNNYEYHIFLVPITDLPGSALFSRTKTTFGNQMVATRYLKAPPWLDYCSNYYSYHYSIYHTLYTHMQYGGLKIAILSNQPTVMGLSRCVFVLFVLKIIGLFCRILSLLLGSLAKETYNNRSN